MNATPRLRQQRLYHFAVNVREAEVAALEAVGELLVIHAEEVEDGGVEVVDGDGIFGDVPGEVVGGAVGLAAFDAAARHPETEGAGVVIAAGDLFETGAIFAKGGAAEFGAPDDEGGIEQAALFEVFQQGSDRLIDHAGIVLQSGIEVAVMIPGGVDDGYRHDGASKDGAAKATFLLNALEEGEYSVQIAGVPNKNRSTKTKVDVIAGDKTSGNTIDQRPAPKIDGIWTEVQKITLKEDQRISVVISNQGADGFVIADAVRLLPMK